MLPRTCAIAVLIAHAAIARADEPGAERTGSASCAACHAEVAAGWRRTSHARSSVPDAEAGAPRCRGCHAVDLGPRAAIGCEACHGPGADYAPEDVMRDTALARALGLRDLSTPSARAALCLTCHRASTRLARFDPEAAWQRIRHGSGAARISTP